MSDGARPGLRGGGRDAGGKAGTQPKLKIDPGPLRAQHQTGWVSDERRTIGAKVVNNERPITAGRGGTGPASRKTIVDRRSPDAINRKTPPQDSGPNRKSPRASTSRKLKQGTPLLSKDDTYKPPSSNGSWIPHFDRDVPGNVCKTSIVSTSVEFDPSWKTAGRQVSDIQSVKVQRDVFLAPPVPQRIRHEEFHEEEIVYRRVGPNMDKLDNYSTSRSYSSVQEMRRVGRRVEQVDASTMTFSDVSTQTDNVEFDNLSPQAGEMATFFPMGTQVMEMSCQTEDMTTRVAALGALGEALMGPGTSMVGLGPVAEDSAAVDQDVCSPGRKNAPAVSSDSSSVGDCGKDGSELGMSEINTAEATSTTARTAATSSRSTSPSLDRLVELEDLLFKQYQKLEDAGILAPSPKFPRLLAAAAAANGRANPSPTLAEIRRLFDSTPPMGDEEKEELYRVSAPDAVSLLLGERAPPAAPYNTPTHDVPQRTPSHSVAIVSRGSRGRKSTSPQDPISRIYGQSPGSVRLSCSPPGTCNAVPSLRPPEVSALDLDSLHKESPRSSVGESPRMPMSHPSGFKPASSRDSYSGSSPCSTNRSISRG